METTYYTLYTRETDEIAQASGEDRLVRFSQCPVPKKAARREDNVIDLSAYRARMKEPEEDVDDEPDCLEEEAEHTQPRARTDHSLDRLRLLEGIACAAMVCVAVAACVVFLL